MESGRKSGKRRLLTFALSVALVGALVPFSPAPPARAATFVVDSTGDEPDTDAGDGSCLTAAGTCTLRAAIQEANQTDGADVITFNIEGNGNEAGEHVIQPGSALPQITESLTIDGSTQPTGIIVVDGSSAGSATGLSLGSGSAGSSILGLVVRDFSGPGIGVFGDSNSNVIAGNVIHGNGNDGIQVQTDGNTIGGVDAELNIIYDNASSGVSLQRDGNTVTNNLIGTSDGETAAPNGTGIFITGANNSVNGNLVSGNSAAGVWLSNTTAINNKITSNRIGTDFAAAQPLPNGTAAGDLGGVVIQSGATGNLMQGNIISSNEDAGILISSADGNEVIDNRIGTDLSALFPLGNNGPGVRLLSASSNQIVDNVISGNIGNGVLIAGGGSNTVESNYIGLTGDGTTALGNSGNGVQIIDSPGNTIGGESGNVVSGNTGEGIRVDGAEATNNWIGGNFVGTDSTGMTDVGGDAVDLGNGASGIYIRRAPGNQVTGNVVSGNNGFAGIAICGDSTSCGGGSPDGSDQTSNASGNIVQENLVGTTADGAGALGNNGYGVSIDGAPGTLVPGAGGVGNTIAHNGLDGVVIFNAGAISNQILGNSIHSNGDLGIDLAADGVTTNDEGDGDIGPNDLQNFPVLTLVSSDGSTTTVEGSLDSAPDTTYLLEFFTNAECDPSGFGEGQTFLGSGGVTTDSGGLATFSFTFEAGVADGTPVTATATRTGGGGTSEFSQCVTVEEASVLYGVESGTDSLSVIDAASGAVTVVGKLGGLGEYETPVAMGVRPSDGALFVWNNSDPPALSLATVDRCTGAATLVGPGGEQLQALAFSPEGALYGLDNALFTVDPTTGAVTQIGHFDGPVIAAADFDADGVLYGVELTGLDVPENLYTVDTDTGSLTLVGPLSTEIGVIGSIVFAPDGTLIGSGMDGPDGPEGDILFDIDPSNAAVSNVRSLDGWAPQGMGFSAPCDVVTGLVGFDLATSSGFEGTTHLVDIVLSVPEGGTISDPVTVTIGEAETGTATSGEDYTLDITSVTFPSESGDGAVQQVSVSLLSDEAIEPGETIDLFISDVTGPAEVDPSAATHRVTILDASLDEGIFFTAVDPGIEIDGPPIFEALGFIPFSELDPLAAVRAGEPEAEEELESVGSGIAGIGSGIAGIGSGIAGINLGVIGSGIAGIGSGIAGIDPPLSTIPITDPADSWEQRLAGTIFEGSPLQSITLSQVSSIAGVLDGLTVGDIDYTSSVLGSLSLASITVGNLTLGEIDTKTDDLSFSCSSSGADACSSTVIQADVAGADMRAIGSGIAGIHIADVDLDLQPIGTTTIGAIGSGIAAIDLIFDCTLVDCSATSTVTLAEAQNLGAIKLTYLGELYLLILPVSSYDWTQLPVDLLHVNVGPLARYDLTFVQQDGPDLETLIEVTLPTGVHYQPETASLLITDPFGEVIEASGLPEPNITTPTVTAQHLQWTIPTIAGLRYQISFGGRINIIALGVHRADASVAAGETTLSATDAAPITITENFEPNNSPSTAAPIDDLGLYVSYLPSSTDEDYFTFAIPDGKVAKVLLHHLDEDFDLIYYEPTTITEASNRSVSEFGPTTPPLDDEGRHTGGEALDPEAADDLDLESIGSGIAGIGSGIAGIGSNRGTVNEEVEGTSDATAVGESGIRVAGYNGASSDQAYLLQLKFVQPFEISCPALPPIDSTITLGSIPAVPGNADTLILWNAQRTEVIYGSEARNNLATALNGLAQTLTDLGHVPVVLPVDGDPAVRAAYDTWDTNPCSATKANGVVAAINDLVDSLGLAPPQLTSITLIGGDVLIPYERRIDLTDIANQREYAPALRNTDLSGSQTGEFGAAQGGWVLSNDAYAAFTSIYDWLGHKLYLPDVGIGRLVELPPEIIAQIGQFVSAQGILNPSTAVTDLDALVTAYDFLIGGANAQKAALDSNFGTGATDPSLINDTWTANDLAIALGDLDNVIGLGAHFDHQRLFPAAGDANYTSEQLLAESFASSLQDRVFFSVGCNSGATVPDFISAAGDYLLPGGGSTTDWAQAFSQIGAVFVGNTAFAYGLFNDDDTGVDTAVGLSEKLMERFTARLDGTFFIGDALAFGKQEHFAEQLVYGPYDEKILAESTLFGFPFWRLTGDVEPTGETLPGPPPGGSQQLSFAHTRVDGGNGSYYQTNGQSTELFHRPIQPQETLEFLTTDETRATGVMIRGLTSRDETPFDPVFARPVFDLAEREPELETEGTIFPNVFAATNSRETADGIVSTVALATGQFIGEGEGVQRLFTDMEVEMLFGAAAGSAPEILLAEAEMSNPSVTFTVVVDGSADEVLVLYKPAGFDIGEVVWSTLSLTETSAEVWTGTVDGVSEQIEWFPQVRSNSFISTSFNKGVLFAARLVDAGPDASVVEGDTHTQNGSFIDPVGSGPYTATIDWGDGTFSEVTSFIDLPDSTARGITADHVYGDDGVYPVEVCVSPLGEGTECDTAAVTVVNADPAFQSVDLTTSGGVVSLAARFGDPGADDTHGAEVDWGDNTSSNPLVDPSNRTVVASHDFGLTDPATVTITVTLTDDDGGTTSVEIVNGNVAPMVGPVVGPTDPVAVDTTVNISAVFSDFDGTGGYTATIDWGDTSSTAGAVSFNDSTRTGTVTGEHIYTAPGVYTVTVTVTDELGASGSDVFEFVVVYDPDGGFVTGGGWIASPAGAYMPEPDLTGKANFGFVSKYQKGKTVPSGGTEFQFRAASFNFKSTSYDWLVIAGAEARFKGEGTVNGALAPTGEPYKFFLAGFDGDLNTNDSHENDRFRIKIWYEIPGNEEIVVYDNQPGEDLDSDAATELGGGSIVIHSR